MTNESPQERWIVILWWKSIMQIIRSYRSWFSGSRYIIVVLATGHTEVIGYTVIQANQGTTLAATVHSVPNDVLAKRLSFKALGPINRASVSIIWDIFVANFSDFSLHDVPCRNVLQDRISTILAACTLQCESPLYM